MAKLSTYTIPLELSVRDKTIVKSALRIFDEHVARDARNHFEAPDAALHNSIAAILSNLEAAEKHVLGRI